PAELLLRIGIARARGRDVERLNRAVQPFQRQLSGWLGFRDILNRGSNILFDQNLPVTRLGAKSRGQVYDGSGRRIVKSSFEANPAKGGVSVRDAHSEPELAAPLAPYSRELSHLLPHLFGHFHGTKRRVRAVYWIVEEHDQSVAGEALDRPLIFVDE